MSETSLDPETAAEDLEATEATSSTGRLALQACGVVVHVLLPPARAEVDKSQGEAQSILSLRCFAISFVPLSFFLSVRIKVVTV